MKIIPGIFEQSKEEIVRKIGLVAPFVKTIQIDVADQTFVPARTPTDFSFLLKVVGSVVFEAHLMVDKPEQYVRNLIQSGFRRVIGHIECKDPREFLEEARCFECEVGLALDAETAVEEVEPYLEEIDVLLVLAAQAGASGQPFEEEVLGKIKAVHRNFPNLPIEIDCGINDKTIKLAAEAGATRFVTTSYIFKDEAKISEAIERLKKASETTHLLIG